MTSDQLIVATHDRSENVSKPGQHPGSGHLETISHGPKKSMPALKTPGIAQGVTAAARAGSAQPDRGRHSTRPRQRRDFHWFTRHYDLPAARSKTLSPEQAVIDDIHHMAQQDATRFPGFGIDADNLAGVVLGMACTSTWLNKFKVRRRTSLRAYTRRTIHHGIMRVVKGKSWMPLFADGLVSTSVGGDPLEIAASKERVSTIESAIEGLSRSEKRILGLAARPGKRRKSRRISMACRSRTYMRRHRIRQALASRLAVDLARTRNPLLIARMIRPDPVSDSCTGNDLREPVDLP